MKENHLKLPFLFIDLSRYATEPEPLNKSSAESNFKSLKTL